MKDETNRNIYTSVILGNQVRWEMVERAGSITAENFKFSDIVNKEKAERTEAMQQFKNRWLQECFFQIIEAGIFSKIKGKYRYRLNRDHINEYVAALNNLTKT